MFLAAKELQSWSQKEGHLILLIRYQPIGTVPANLQPGTTLLLLAAKLALPDMLEVLLRHEAHPRLLDLAGCSPLAAAVTSGACRHRPLEEQFESTQH